MARVNKRRVYVNACFHFILEIENLFFDLTFELVFFADFALQATPSFQLTVTDLSAKPFLYDAHSLFGLAFNLIGRCTLRYVAGCMFVMLCR